MSTKDIQKDREIFYLSHGNVVRMFVFKKSERIGAAVLLIASRIKANVLLRQRLEEGAIHLLDGAFDVLDSGEGENLEKNMLKLMALLEIAARIKVLSEQNVFILREECHSLLSFIEDRRDALIGIPLFEGTHFFDSEELGTLEKRTREWKGNILINETSGSTLNRETSPAPKVRTTSPGTALAFDKKHGERREKILKIVGEKGKVTIKDISREMPECSEKTVQRELLSLVEEGALKKEGVRRWSTYQLQ